jgi:hypothetical protein
LFLIGNPIGAAGAAAIGGSTRARSLVYLNLLQCRIGDEGAIALAESDDQLPGLAKLYLGSNGLTDVSVQALASSPVLGHLSTLSLRDNRLTDASAHALAGSKHVRCLQELELYGTRITEEGAWALVESPYLTSLTSLGLGSTRFSQALQEAIQERFRGR